MEKIILYEQQTCVQAQQLLAAGGAGVGTRLGGNDKKPGMCRKLQKKPHTSSSNKF